MTNKIDSTYPSPSQQSSPTFLYPYAPLPNALNTPVAAVSEPHPYAIKVAPPPGFNTQVRTPEDSVKTVSDGELAPEDRFAGWSDNDVIVGNQQTMEAEFERWSDDEDVIVGNQEPVEDIYASWSDAEEIVTNQHIPDDRFTSWSDSGMLTENHEAQENIYGSWNDAGMLTGNHESQDDIYGSWSESQTSNSEQQTGNDRYVTLNNDEVITVNEGSKEDLYTTWNERETNTPIDRYEAWSDTEAGLNGEQDNRVPAGIQPTANFEPVMVESRVVVSRVPPPPSMLAGHRVEDENQRMKRSISDRILLPLPLLRQ